MPVCLLFPRPPSASLVSLVVSSPTLPCPDQACLLWRMSWLHSPRMEGAHVAVCHPQNLGSGFMRAVSLCSRMSLKSSPLRTPVWDTLSFLVLGNPGPGGFSSSSDHGATPPSPHCVKGVLCHHATPHFLSTVHRNAVVLGWR